MTSTSTQAKDPEIAAPVDDTSVFTCRMCGQCCRGEGGIVVSPKDLLRITCALNMSAEEFAAKYGEMRGGKLQIRTGEDGFCIFFAEGKGCTVHAGKPDVCRAWPFFRGNIVDPDSLEMAKDFCPGIDKNCTHAEFARAGRAYLAKHGLLAHPFVVRENCQGENDQCVLLKRPKQLARRKIRPSLCQTTTAPSWKGR